MVKVGARYGLHTLVKGPQMLVATLEFHSTNTIRAPPSRWEGVPPQV